MRTQVWTWNLFLNPVVPDPVLDKVNQLGVSFCHGNITFLSNRKLYVKVGYHISDPFDAARCSCYTTMTVHPRLRMLNKSSFQEESRRTYPVGSHV